MNVDRLDGRLTFAGNLANLLGLVALAIAINDITEAVRAQELGSMNDQTQALFITSIQHNADRSVR